MCVSRKKKEPTKSRGFCFTSFDESAKFEDAYPLKDGDYLVYGREKTEDGRPHLQGFYFCFNPRSVKSVQKDFKPRHVEATSYMYDAVVYCKKGEQSHAEWMELHEDGPNYGKNAQVVERGVFPDRIKAGKRRGDKKCSGSKRRAESAQRFRRIIECAEAGDFQTIKEEDPCRYLMSFNTLVKIHQFSIPRMPDLVGPLENYFLWGPPRCGKSWKARHILFPGLPRYIKDPGTQWWDNYAGEPVVVIDELCAGHMSLAMIAMYKTWCDTYAFQAQFKGGSFKAIRPQHIVITSNHPLNRIFCDDVDCQAMEERFHVEHMTERYIAPVVPPLSPVPLSQLSLDINFDAFAD